MIACVGTDQGRVGSFQLAYCIEHLIGTAAPTRRTRRGCSGRPCRRPASSGPGVQSRGWERRSGPCAGPSPAVAAEKLPVGKASGLGNRLHPPGDLRLRQPEHFLFAGRAGRMASSALMAAGVMATTAPWASVSVLERATVMRPLPSSQRCTSPQ